MKKDCESHKTELKNYVKELNIKTVCLTTINEICRSSVPEVGENFIRASLTYLVTFFDCDSAVYKKTNRLKYLNSR